MALLLLAEIEPRHVPAALVVINGDAGRIYGEREVDVGVLGPPETLALPHAGNLDMRPFERIGLQRFEVLLIELRRSFQRRCGMLEEPGTREQLAFALAGYPSLTSAANASSSVSNTKKLARGGRVFRWMTLRLFQSGVEAGNVPLLPAIGRDDDRLMNRKESLLRERHD